VDVIPIVYPLGFLPTGEYELERTNEVNINLTADELVRWTQVLSDDIGDEMNLLKSLVEKGAIIEFENSNGLLRSLQNNVAMRLGEGWSDNGKTCIVKENKLYFITEIQHNIWLMSNGTVVVDKIYSDLRDKYIKEDGEFADDFCKSIIYLVKSELLCLR